MTENNPRTTVFTQIAKRKRAFAGVFVVVFMLSFGVLYAIDFYPELVLPEERTLAIDIGDTEGTADTPTGSTVPPLVFETITPTETQVSDDTPATDATTTAESDTDQAVSSTEPENVISATVPPEVALGTSESDADPYPLSLTIESLGKTIDVLNPTSREVADLDAALLEGVVRHPDSATFTNEGNIFILGHSSYLPNVLNRNFQAFNGIQNLKWGDLITVRSADTVYSYRVDKVYHAKAGELTVPIAGTGPRLTLATCNSFGSKDDRYIVEATLVGQKRL